MHIPTVIYISQSIKVSQFIPSVHKSTKQFGFSFANDTPMVWSELPDEIRSASSFQKELAAYLFSNAHPH